MQSGREEQLPISASAASGAPPHFPHLLPKLVTLDFPLKTSRIENFFHDLVPQKHMYLISNLNLFGFNMQTRGMTIASLINCWYLEMVTNLTSILHNSDDVTRLTHEAKKNVLEEFHTFTSLPLSI